MKFLITVNNYHKVKEELVKRNLKTQETYFRKDVVYGGIQQEELLYRQTNLQYEE